MKLRNNGDSKLESAGKRGLTLVELLVSMAIVAYMLTVLYFCLIQGIRVYKTSEETVPAFREGSKALQQICRDLQIGSYELIYPGLYDLTQEGTHGIVFARYDFMTKEREIVGYFLDERAAQIKRTLYNPAFASLDPSQLETLKGALNPKKVSSARSLRFRIEEDGLLSISIRDERKHSHASNEDKVRIHPGGGYFWIGISIFCIALILAEKDPHDNIFATNSAIFEDFPSAKKVFVHLLERNSTHCTGS